MNKLTKAAVVISILTALLINLTACGGGQSNSGTADTGTETGESVTLLFADSGAPGQASTTALEHFVEVVKERTNGEVVIDLQSNCALGSEEETIESCMLGTIDFVLAGCAAYSGVVPEYCVCDLPFAFESAEDAYAFYDGEFGQLLFDKAAEVGLIGMAYAENGFRNLTNNVREIHTPDDMKGLKMRTQSSQIYMDMMSALGASATPIPYGELYTSLQQKTVDGEDNTISCIYSARFYEVQKFITLDQHTFDSNIICMSAKTREKLTDEQFEIIKAAAYECAVESREINHTYEQEWIEEMEEYGVTVTSLSPEERALFVEATKDVYKSAINIVGEDFVNTYLKAIGRQ